MYKIDCAPICMTVMMVDVTSTTFKKHFVRSWVNFLVVNGKNGAYNKNTKYGIDKTAGRAIKPIQISIFFSEFCPLTENNGER